MTTRCFPFVAVTVFSIILVLCGMADCASPEGAQKGATSTVRTSSTARLSGYLSEEALPKGLAFIPAPPRAGSTALALDEEISREALVLQGTTRWKVAAGDAEISSPKALDSFSCAVDVPINPQDTPRLSLLLARTLMDVSRAVRVVKKHYHRLRPFVVNKKPTCTPEYQAQMERSSSYPSSHSAIGWAWALILSEIAPERASAILARGRDFGQGRIVCNVHWNSDVVEGRVLAAGTVARLHADQAFRADLEAAKADVAAARAKGLKPAAGRCSEEAAAFAAAGTRGDTPGL